MLGFVFPVFAFMNNAGYRFSRFLKTLIKDFDAINVPSK
jgi:hypothetical protein